MSRISIFALENFDFAGLMPVLDDPDGLMAVKGAGKLDGSVSPSRSAGGKLAHGHFDIDLAGTEFRLRHEYFPVKTAALSLDWEPQAARFTIERWRAGHRTKFGRGFRRSRARARRRLWLGA